MTHWVQVWRPTRHKIGHFRGGVDVSTTDFFDDKPLIDRCFADTGRTFRRRIFGTFRRQPLDVCVVVICWFNTVLRVRVILSAGDVDCSFPASFSFRWLWFLVIWSSSQLVGMDCSFPATFAFPLWFLGVWFNGQFIHRLLCSCAVLHWMTVTRKQACWRLTGHQQNDVIRFRGSEWRRRPHECHCTVRHFVWNLLLTRFQSLT